MREIYAANIAYLTKINTKETKSIENRNLLKMMLTTISTTTTGEKQKKKLVLAERSLFV